jgi:poly(glycerol-phosphate) alpha-glucosyltransferase
MISRFHLNSPKERARYLNTDSPQINFENSWICVARLERVKLVHEVIAAHRFVCTVIPNSILYIIGEGSEQKNLQLQVEINGLEENVVFAGDRSQEFIATIAPNFCLQAAPLSGRSLLELGLAGLPAVAFDTDWHSEIIKDGINGFLVEKGNIKLFADRAIEIMLNRQLRQEFSSAMLSLSNEKVENDNSKILLDVYHELLH